MTLIVHGDSNLNTQVIWAREPELELELVSEYLIAPKLEPELEVVMT